MVATYHRVLHNNVVDDPFYGEFVGVPHTQAFANADRAVTLALTNVDALAVTISELTASTLQAVIDVRDQAPHEVAAHLLLAGTVTIMAAHRPSFKILGEHMSIAVSATASAWKRFGATGKWSTPPRLTLPATTKPTLAIELAPARALNADENINADYTDDVLDRVGQVGDSFANTAREAFTEFVRHELPVGELVDAIDVTVVEHTRIAADLTVALRHDLRQFANTIETSYRAHRGTGLWAAPLVTMTTSAATDVPAHSST